MMSNMRLAPAACSSGEIFPSPFLSIALNSVSAAFGLAAGACALPTLPTIVIATAPASFEAFMHISLIRAEEACVAPASTKCRLRHTLRDRSHRLQGTYRLACDRP